MHPRSETIDRLKGVAAILVVVGHAMTFLFKGNTAENGAMNAFVFGFIYCIHVPLFILLCGYLCHKQDLRKFYKKKARRILIPFLIFSIFKLIYSLFISKEYSHGSNISEQLFEAFINGSYYWFCYAIILMYLISPLFWNGEKKAVRRLLIINSILIIINIVIPSLNIKLTKILSFDGFVSYLPFYLNGMILYKSRNDLKLIETNYRPLLIIVSSIIILCCLGLYYSYSTGVLGWLIRFISAHCYIYLFYLALKKIKLKNIKLRLLSIIGNYSFQIMLFDSFFKVILCTLLAKITNNLALIAITSIIINISLSVISCEIIKRIKYMNILFGLNYNTK